MRCGAEEEQSPRRLGGSIGNLTFKEHVLTVDVTAGDEIVEPFGADGDFGPADLEPQIGEKY